MTIFGESHAKTANVIAKHLCLSKHDVQTITMTSRLGKPNDKYPVSSLMTKFGMPSSTPLVAA